MRGVIFTDELVLVVEVDGVDLVSTGKGALVERVEPASPNCVLMFIVDLFAQDVCVLSSLLNEASMLRLKTAD